MPHYRSDDRRVQKTQALLHGALASLIHEKSYQDIVVKEILGRANVGRSTFYAHFRDKDDLLESGMRDRLCAGGTIPPTGYPGRVDRALRFSLPLFEHIERYRASGDASGPHGHAVVHEHLERVLADVITEELRGAGWCREQRSHTVPCDLLARHVACTFLLVLNWWAGMNEPLPARTINDLFRALVVPALTED